MPSPEIKDRDYYEEDGEIIDSKTEIDDYLEVDVNGYFVQRDLDDNGFYLTNLDVIPSD